MTGDTVAITDDIEMMMGREGDRDRDREIETGGDIAIDMILVRDHGHWKGKDGGMMGEEKGNTGQGAEIEDEMRGTGSDAKQSETADDGTAVDRDLHSVGTRGVSMFDELVQNLE